MCLLTAAACQRQVTGAAGGGVGGDARRGGILIEREGCGSCHEIPGSPAAHGLAGPPLTRFAGRTVIAGVLPNTPKNLIRWLKDPPSIVPGVAMPNVGLDDRDARDIAAYLYKIR